MGYFVFLLTNSETKQEQHWFILSHYIQSLDWFIKYTQIGLNDTAEICLFLRQGPDGQHEARSFPKLGESDSTFSEKGNVAFTSFLCMCHLQGLLPTPTLLKRPQLEH